MQESIGLDFDLATQFLAPFALLRIKAFVQVGSYKGMQDHFQLCRLVLSRSAAKVRS